MYCGNCKHSYAWNVEYIADVPERTCVCKKCAGTRKSKQLRCLWTVTVEQCVVHVLEKGKYQKRMLVLNIQLAENISTAHLVRIMVTI